MTGFTLVEVMIVVVIIGILVAVALPVFYATMSKSQQKTCFANQRTLDGAVPSWQAVNPSTNTTAALAGVVDASNPLITSGTLLRPPRCPSAPNPVDPNNPTAAEGAYVFQPDGELVPCPFGRLGTHGSYQ